MTPFPHTPAFNQLQAENRIFSYDWDDYTADKVVFRPKQMTAERLQEMLYYAWDTFYGEIPQQVRMSRLFQQVMRKEKADQTYRPRRRDLIHQAFGRTVNR